MFTFFTKHLPRVYLDNAGATPLGASARQAMIDASAVYGNPSAIHHEGDVAARLLHKARAICAQTLNAHSYEIYFVGSGTESCNMAVTGTVEGWRHQRADGRSQTAEDRQEKIPHIITSVIEHPAVLEPIRHLQREGKVRVTCVPVYENGIVRVRDIQEALSDETVLVSIMYANNEIGTIQPIKDIGRAIDEWKRSHGRTFNEYPYFHVDACQAANYLNLDILRLKCHMMTVNSSKCYGPKGIALLYKREGVRVDSVSYGGGQERGMRSGTESVASAYGFALALQESAGMRDKESLRLQELRDYGKAELITAIPGITFYGAWEETRQQTGDKRQQKHLDTLRLPHNINCRVPGIPSDEMIIRLDAHGFAVSHKSACASSETDGSYVIEALGASKQEALENVRITLGRSTTKSDVKRLVMAMKEIKEAFGR